MRKEYEYWPVVLSNCADCGVGTIAIGEDYVVNDEVWETAWAGRRKSFHALPGQEILCVGCLEKRIGRTLTSCDFIDAPINDPAWFHKSDRLLDRLARGLPEGQRPTTKARWQMAVEDLGD